ncbi:MAG: polyphosphate kinase 2 family protein [Gammaproteobacteria bacterium]|nr:polyphosphate kinase 2 family protein [Gammaproteobacteria bacterium]
MFTSQATLHRVAYDGSFRVAETSSKPPKGKTIGSKRRLKTAVKNLDELQQRLAASDRHSLLLIFQAMDAAGKDSTIRAVMQGINPAGCQVFSFKKPGRNELDHDFLWRTSLRMPERGRIGIFNRSQYEEVLIVRVHPEILQQQKLPASSINEGIWTERFESICDQEKHLARNGTVILKFWLNVSHEEQKRRFLRRLDKPEKNWKFEPGDVAERAHWDDYMRAYEDALNATSTPWAPWYAIPADNKPYMRATVAETITAALDSLDLEYPSPSDENRQAFAAARQRLMGADG